MDKGIQAAKREKISQAFRRRSDTQTNCKGPADFPLILSIPAGAARTGLCRTKVSPSHSFVGKREISSQSYGFIHLKRIFRFPGRKCAMQQVQQENGMSVGVKMMDRDHMELSEMVLELNLEAAAGKPWERTGNILKEMARALGSHFALEQTMMESTRYPGVTIHRLRHEWMMDQMRVLTARCKKDGVEANRMLLELLSESHFAHMQTDDLNYGLWLNAGMARPAGAAQGIAGATRQQNIDLGIDAGIVRPARPVVYVERVEEHVIAPVAERELVTAGRR
jgi:hemerythrin-like metal-binding protein